MNAKIVIIGESSDETNQVRDILSSDGCDVAAVRRPSEIEEQIESDHFSAVIADCDTLGENTLRWLCQLRANGLKTTFILYGDRLDGHQVSELLRSGVYDFIPRGQLPDRVRAAVAEGLENRSAFIEITASLERLRHYNKLLQQEKAALKRRNQELDFINRLTTAVAYNLDWDSVLGKMLDAGFLEAANPHLAGILYHSGSRWKMSLHLDDMEVNKAVIDRLKKDIAEKFNALSDQPISSDDIAHQIYPSNVTLSSADPICLDNAFWQPLVVGGSHLGLFFVMNRGGRPFLFDTRELLVTVGNILAMSFENAYKYNRLRQQAATDPLTGIVNRQAFRNHLKRELHRCRRYGGVMSLIMIDVDSFKSFNDTQGHLAGDYILIELSRCMAKALRKSDVLARFGGDEFAVILPETSPEMTQTCLHRLQGAVNAHRFSWDGRRLDVGVSCGTASTSELGPNEDETALIGLADSRLYLNKAARGTPRNAWS